MLKRWVMTNVHFLCLVQVTRIYIEVEETLLSFVLASKRVPRCKEEAVLYKRMDRFCAKHSKTCIFQLRRGCLI